MKFESKLPAGQVSQRLGDGLRYNWFEIISLWQGGYTGLKVGRLFCLRYSDGEDWIRRIGFTYMYGAVLGGKDGARVYAFNWYGLSFAAFCVVYLLTALVLWLATSLGTGGIFLYALAWAAGIDVAVLIINFFFCKLNRGLSEYSANLKDYVQKIASL